MLRRNAFTLVEMLVAMALTMFIMIIISTAFVTGLETFRRLKGIGDMQQNLRMAAQRLKSDLEMDHFEGYRRLGDPAFASQGKVRRGFFRIVYAGIPAMPQVVPGPPSYPTFEGDDLDGVPELRAYRAVDQVLHFSIKLRGDRRQDFLSANVPPNSPLLNPQNVNFFGQPPDASYQNPNRNEFNSQWAEVAYFLVPTGLTTRPTTANPTPLYDMYRTQHLVVPRNDKLQGANAVPFTARLQYGQLSWRQGASGSLHFNTPEDLAGGTGSRALPLAGISGGTPVNGLPNELQPAAALLLSNVVSFQVRISRTGLNFADLPRHSNSPGIYDTAGRNNPQPIKAIQITLRIWDDASRQTRQITIVQDM